MRREILKLSALLLATVLLSQLVPRSSANDVTTIAKPEEKAQFATLEWKVIANNGTYIPNTDLNFGSYGQPAVNTRGVVTFRARSVGSSERETGIYMREPKKGATIQVVGNINAVVPFPNNLNTEFTEFPSIPRIAMNVDNVATRGNHQPVYRYFLPDETETRAGTTGIYAKLGRNPFLTGASKLGNVPGFEFYAVPGISPRLQFDVFPGSPAITDDGTIVFKGNYTETGIGKTGVFYRRLVNIPAGGPYSVELIANSDTEIPNTPPGAGIIKFGSTAPPSVAGNQVVFVGLDNEENPSYGGIYIASIQPNPTLITLAGIGAELPGLQIPGLTRIGEGLSFDGRYLAFWGAWGNDTKTIRLYCPEEGNAQRRAYCNGIDPNSVFDPTTGKWYQEKQVPVNQGIFVYDVNANWAFLAADLTNFDDFTYWNYSGMAPGEGHDGSNEEGEPVRWRGTAFMSVSDGLVVFKARTGDLNDQNLYVNPVDGIYLVDVTQNSARQVIFETGMDGADLDPTLLPGEFPITNLGIEREGFRGRYLSIAATMGDEETGWGGIYLATVESKKAKH
ncbi:MAG TPA: hypothetical protein VFY67_20230 [Pyrinomonadaceae bacterium]|nr:hypothetical protein [Pyrinomonadaceae bacterium]